MSSLTPEIKKIIDEKADKYAFQIPYNGTNNFYNDDKLKGFIDGATEVCLFPSTYNLIDKNETLCFIKATEKLPETPNAYVHVKINDDGLEIKGLAHPVQNDKWYDIVSDKLYTDKQIEWLSPYTSQKNISEEGGAVMEENKRLRELLDKASMLVGNPGTNISASTDIACESWQKEYDELKAKQSLNK